MAYATIDELTDHIGRTPINAQLLLDRASRDVDRALLTAVYDVDDNGAATDPDVIAALKLATLEQVAAGLDAGNTTGNGVTVSGGFSIGKISVQAASGTQTGAARMVGPLWEQAWLVLQQAGLTGHGPMTL